MKIFSFLKNKSDPQIIEGVEPVDFQLLISEPIEGDGKNIQFNNRTLFFSDINFSEKFELGRINRINFSLEDMKQVVFRRCVFEEEVSLHSRYNLQNISRSFDRISFQNCEFKNGLEVYLLPAFTILFSQVKVLDKFEVAIHQVRLLSIINTIIFNPVMLQTGNSQSSLIGLHIDDDSVFFGSSVLFSKQLLSVAESLGDKILRVTIYRKLLLQYSESAPFGDKLQIQIQNFLNGYGVFFWKTIGYLIIFNAMISWVLYICGSGVSWISFFSDILPTYIFGFSKPNYWPLLNDQQILLFNIKMLGLSYLYYLIFMSARRFSYFRK